MLQRPTTEWRMLLEWRFLFRLAGIENLLLLVNKAIGTASSEGVNITLTIEKYPNIFFGHTKCGRPTLQKSFFGNRRKLISEKFDTAYPSSLVRPFALQRLLIIRSVEYWF
jgi:hypothetical protein